MSTEPATPSPDETCSNCGTALDREHQPMSLGACYLGPPRPATPSPEADECSSLSSAEETWISEAVIALTYTPIDPARLFQWPGHSGLTLDSEQARDAAIRVLAHMQAKSIPTPAAPSSSGGAQRVEAPRPYDENAIVTAKQLRSAADLIPDVKSARMWMRDAADELDRIATPAASGEAQDPPEAESWCGGCSKVAPTSWGLCVDCFARADLELRDRIANFPTPAGGEGTDR